MTRRFHPLVPATDCSGRPQPPETLQSARQRPVGNNRSATLHSAIVHDPDPGTFTYSLSMRREVGSGNVTMVADSANKSFLLVEDIGAAP